MTTGRVIHVLHRIQLIQLTLAVTGRGTRVSITLTAVPVRPETDLHMVASVTVVHPNSTRTMTAGVLLTRGEIHPVSQIGKDFVTSLHAGPRRC